MRRPLTTPFLFCMLVVAVALAAAVAALAAPSAAANAITVTAPAGTATYTIGDALSVSWSIQAPVTGGYFCVYVNDGTGEEQKAQSVKAGRGLSYTTTMTLDCPPGSGYYATVKYRANRNAAFTMAADSPGTFTIVMPPLPFQTLAYSPWQESVVKGQPHTFRFEIDHPDPGVVIASGVIEFRNSRTNALAATRAITDIAPGEWVVTSTWSDAPVLNATTIVCDLPVGGYSWMARVTTSAGATAGGGEGYLSVTRR